MKIKLIILFSMFLPQFLLAQEVKEKPTAIFIVKSSSSSKEVVTRNLIMPFSSAQSFEIMNAEEVKKRFPNSKNIVAYAVTLNPDVKLSTLKDFYKERKLTGGEQKGLMVDGNLIADTSDALIEVSSVTSIDSKSNNIKIETLSKDKSHGLKKLRN